MAKIAVVVSNPCISDARVIKMIQAAYQNGHKVVVFCTKAANVKAFEYTDGVEYHRFEWKPVPYILNKTFIRYLGYINKKLARFIAIKLVFYLRYSVWAQIFSPYIAAEKPDIIHAHDLICLPAGFKAAQICGAKVVYDAHELEVFRNPPLPILKKIFVSYIEKKYGRKADAVNTVGELIKQKLAKHLNRQDINVIYNSPIIKPTTLCIRKDLRLDNETLLLLYVGKVAVGRGIETIIYNLPHLPDNVVFATVGPCDHSMKVKMFSLAKKLRLNDRFFILPEVRFEHVTNYIKNADAGIIQLDTLPISYQLAMPNKLFEMAFANVPIIANQLPEIELFLKEFNNGVIIDFSDTAQLSCLISKLFYYKNNYKFQKEGYKRLYNKYSWEVQTKKLLNTYASLYQKQ
ncbi:MAG TPA: glycosyltransferase [Candidatus Megaira endosymbiont of Stentor roeselii]|jgi:glycosyltransferase involved in cell wall biosynthesis|nr:MAG: glycosyltransferase [Candidatus Megaira endosymbiont of Mesostigma viride]HJK86032.1 glycosyltransferase [Candidatus Megaera endosymbiont of Stentor roeselii]HJK88452.1 glycosyltransferase [Candidatus Megaira endosymbiont of Mesostigma viride]